MSRRSWQIRAAWSFRAFRVGATFGVFTAGLAIAGNPVQGQDFGESAAEVQPAVNNGFLLNDANFDLWVFGNAQKGNARPEDRLRSALAMRLDEVEGSCTLSDAQKQKLLLAGRGDLKRFNDRLADARAVFDRLKTDQNNINAIFQETQPLAASFQAGLFGEDSLFAKTVETTLTPEQAARRREAVLDQRRFRYKAKVALALANLDDAVSFTAEQNRRFLALILEETIPPEKFAGPQEANLVLFQIARIPETKVRPIFDDAQWKVLNRRLQQARRLEPTLRANGLLDPAPPTRPEKRGARND